MKSNGRGKRQERFIQEYLVDLNATQAAIRAGYSKRTADVQGSQLLGKLRAKIEPLLRGLQQQNAEACGISRERWLLEIKRCAFFDPRKFFDSHGNPLEIKDLDDDSAPAIAGFEFFEEFTGKGESRIATGYTKKFKLVNKRQALELFGRAVGHYTDEPPPPPLSELEQASIDTLLTMKRTLEGRMTEMKELIDARPTTVQES